MYVQFGGTETNRSRFMVNLKEKMKDEIVLLSSPGTATIVMSKAKAESVLKLEKDDNQNDYLNIKSIADRIKQKI